MSEQPSYLAGLLDRVRSELGEAVVDTVVHVGQGTVELHVDHAHAALRRLHDEFGFRQLVDLCGVDYLDHGRSDWQTSDEASAQGFSRARQTPVSSQDGGLFEFGANAGGHVEDPDERRYAVVYHLLSHENNQRLRIKVYTHGEPPRVESVVDIWACADWYEREAFDLFGVLFEGHPDLRRLLTDYGFVGHPFRKDFPLSGEVEVRYDETQRRVVYEPVSIEPRTLVPRVVRQAGADEVPPADGGANDADAPAA